MEICVGSPTHHSLTLPKEPLGILLEYCLYVVSIPLTISLLYHLQLLLLYNSFRYFFISILHGCFDTCSLKKNAIVKIIMIIIMMMMLIMITIKKTIIIIIIQLAVPAVKMNRIQCSDWLPKRARWLETACFDPAQEKKCVERTYRVRNSWTISATKSQIAAEDSENKRKNKRQSQV